MKWKAEDYGQHRQFQDWTPPKRVYPADAQEKDALRALKYKFQPLPPYKEMETHAIEQETLVSLEIPIPTAQIAFLENTAEKCTSPETKHSAAGMQSAKHWVQRVDTPIGMFSRLTDGYGVSLMFGERCHQFIRNSNNWRGSSGCLLDIDVFRDEKHPNAPEPVYSQDELLQRYPLLSQICSLLLPSASSLYEGRPFKARGIVFFQTPITDQRVYRAFGDILCAELDCIPANVTKNPVAVGFGNTHNAHDAWIKLKTDADWIQAAIEQAESDVLSKTKKRNREQKEKAERAEHYRKQHNTHGERDPLREFIEQCDPVAEMIREGLLTPGKGTEYRWHESDHDRSCAIHNNVIHIFSHSMSTASPAPELEPVNAHRFYLYQMAGLDLTKDNEKAKCREFLFQRGYGSDPKEWDKRAQRQEKRYHVNSDVYHDTSDITTERNRNKKALEDWIQTVYNSETKELLVLGSAAGTAKTTIAITTPANLLYISKTTEEADQVFQVLFDAGEDAIRHRSRLYNRDHENWDTLPLGLGTHERPCFQPELCNLYAQRGHPTHEVCKRCRVYSECKADGWLSQEEKERNAQKVVYAWDETVACDSIHAHRVKRICTTDDILIVDEVNPANLTQQRSVTREMLYDLTERFRDINTVAEYQTLKTLLDIISTAEEDTFIRELKTYIESLEDISELDKKLMKYPVGYTFEKVKGENYKFKATLHYRGKEVTVPVVSHETHEDTPVFEIEPDTPITTGIWQLSLMPLSVLIKVGLISLDDPPLRYNHLLSDIQKFLEQHPNLETAPFIYDPKKQVFDYHLKPTLNHHRAIFNTASDPDNLIVETYHDTDVNITHHTGTTPAWKTDFVFQIATGNYLPRHSLLGSDDDKKLHLKPRAQQMIDDFIRPSVDAGLKTLIVAPKAFQRVPELDALRKHPNVEMINHHHAEGRNDYQDFDIVFIFHYEPEHYEVQQIAKRIHRNPETPLDFSREKRKIVVGGVIFEKVTYTDARVQAVYNRECRQRLMQSAMRLRPNIHPDKILVFFTSEPVDIPVTPIAFFLSDADNFNGNWQAFSEHCRQKAKAENTGDVKTLTDAGMSERTAQRRTKATRKQGKNNRDAEILRRYATGESKKQIATEMKISRDTVKRLLDAQVF